MKRDENGENDYREEEGVRRLERTLERALNKQDPFYPNELHRQDVLKFYGGVDEIDLRALSDCVRCGMNDEFILDYMADGTPHVFCGNCGKVHTVFA